MTMVVKKPLDGIRHQSGDLPGWLKGRKASGSKAATCPSCGGENVCVYDTRPSERGTRRRRLCSDCDVRWTTIEVPLGSDVGIGFRTDAAAILRDLDNLRTRIASLLAALPTTDGEGA